MAGIGFFTDSYDIFAINLITSMLGMVFWQGDPIPHSNMGGNYGIMPTAVGDHFSRYWLSLTRTGQYRNQSCDFRRCGRWTIGLWVVSRCSWEEEDVRSRACHHHPRNLGAMSIRTEPSCHADWPIDLLESGDGYWAWG